MKISHTSTLSKARHDFTSSATVRYQIRFQPSGAFFVHSIVKWVPFKIQNTGSMASTAILCRGVPPRLNLRLEDMKLRRGLWGLSANVWYANANTRNSTKNGARRFSSDTSANRSKPLSEKQRKFLDSAVSLHLICALIFAVTDHWRSYVLIMLESSLQLSYTQRRLHQLRGHTHICDH